MARAEKESNNTIQQSVHCTPRDSAMPARVSNTAKRVSPKKKKTQKTSTRCPKTKDSASGTALWRMRVACATRPYLKFQRLQRGFFKMESEKRERPSSAGDQPSGPSEVRVRIAASRCFFVSDRSRTAQQGALKKVRTHKKRRIAVVYGYRGKNYHGSAKPGGTAEAPPTIEADLEKALKQAGAIDDQGTLSNISFSRASRTDKGVSAMANACAGQLYFSQEEIDNRSIWIDRVNSFLPEQIRVWYAYRVRGSFSAKEAPCSRTYDYVAPSFCFSPSDEPVMDDATLANLNAVLLYYLGTNNFHNYTNGKNVNSADAKRVIQSFRVLDKVMIDGRQFLHFRIKGQSFMLHQIRKMMCMVMQIGRQGGLRGAVDGSSERSRRIIHGSFGAPHINIMKAPSVGLFLKEVHFDVYNREWGTGEGRERVELSPELAERAEQFARAHIWPDIAAESIEFRNFLTDLAEYPLSFDEVVNTCLEMEAARELKRERFGGVDKTVVSHF